MLILNLLLLTLYDFFIHFYWFLSVCVVMAFVSDVEIPPMFRCQAQYPSKFFAHGVLTWCAVFICLPVRSLNRLCCQQALLDKLGQWHNQQVQSGWQRVGGAGNSKERVSQRHSSCRDGWVELFASALDCCWGLLKGCEEITSLTSKMAPK